MDDDGGKEVDEDRASRAGVDGEVAAVGVGAVAARPKKLVMAAVAAWGWQRLVAASNLRLAGGGLGRESREKRKLTAMWSLYWGGVYTMPVAFGCRRWWS
jgi:hypothetical protein